LSTSARFVYSARPLTLAVVAKIYAVRNLTPFMTARGTRSRVNSSRKQAQPRSKYNIPSRAEHSVVLTISLRAPSIQSCRQHPAARRASSHAVITMCAPSIQSCRQLPFARRASNLALITMCAPSIQSCGQYPAARRVSQYSGKNLIVCRVFDL
jgi:hypothetical protein